MLLGFPFPWEVFHEKMSLSFFGDDSDLSTFQVFDFKSLKEVLSALYPVVQGEAPLSSLPKEIQAFAKTKKLYNALPTLKHYPLGEHIYVTLINDKVDI